MSNGSVKHFDDIEGAKFDFTWLVFTWLVGVVVQCINHSPITQEPSVRFHVEAMQHHKQQNKQSIKAALKSASKSA